MTLDEHMFPTHVCSAFMVALAAARHGASPRFPNLPLAAPDAGPPWPSRSECRPEIATGTTTIPDL